MTEKLTGMSSLKNTVKKSQSCPEAEQCDAGSQEHKVPSCGDVKHGIR